MSRPHQKREIALPPRNPLSILSRATPEHLVLEPYPHVVIEDALPADVFAQLFESFPSDEVVVDGRPVKDTWYDYPACKVVKDQRVATLWREFFAHHTSSAFFQELVQLAGPALRKLHPELEARSAGHWRNSAWACDRGAVATHWRRAPMLRWNASST